MNSIKKLIASLALSGICAIPAAADRDYSQIVTQGDFTFDDLFSTWNVTSDITGAPVAVSTNTDKDSSSKLVFNFTVPEGEKAVLSFTAVIEAVAPNGLSIFLGNGSIGNYMMGENREPQVIPVSVELESGSYEVELVHWITIDRVLSGKQDDPDRSYIYDLSLVAASLSEHEAVLVDTEADFGMVYIKNNSETVTRNVRLLNKGTQALEVLSVNGDGVFGGTIPETKALTGEELVVSLDFKAGEAGEYSGEVSIITNAGDFVVPCSAVVSQLDNNVVYFTGFESGHDDWTLHDADGDGRNWMCTSLVETDRYEPYEGRESIVSYGIDPETGLMFSPENWIISPAIEIPSAEKAELSFYVADNDYGESYQVMVSTVGPSLLESDYALVHDGFQYSEPWHEETVDLTDYAGKTVNIAFRHNYSNNWLMLDNVKVTAEGGVGISSTANNKEVESERYYLPDGAETDSDATGVMIKITTYSDKTTAVHKLIK